jgi:hypothetical protein
MKLQFFSAAEASLVFGFGDDAGALGAGFFAAAGLAGFLLSIVSLCPLALLALLMISLAPVIYSLVICKQLERRGEIGDDSARMQGER